MDFAPVDHHQQSTTQECLLVRETAPEGVSSQEKGREKLRYLVVRLFARSDADLALPTVDDVVAIPILPLLDYHRTRGEVLLLQGHEQDVTVP